MNTLNSIGLETTSSALLRDQLNVLLANYQITYQNIRGAHWNIKGPAFFELHVQFETMYNAAALMIDSIAERVLTLGGTPLHRFSDYLEMATISESTTQRDGKALVTMALENFQSILELERQALTLAADSGDEGTVTLLSDDITALEKQQWMLSAWLGA
ncbi:MAG: DNA starvation/stationary phase protection protein [Flavobacteriales bacterium]|nr:DNA starvation/stationary phase protection protein [Flavobacteriales bacterium]